MVVQITKRKIGSEKDMGGELREVWVSRGLFEKEGMLFPGK